MLYLLTKCVIAWARNGRADPVQSFKSFLGAYYLAVIEVEAFIMINAEPGRVFEVAEAVTKIEGRWSGTRCGGSI